jgi:hypothetical protein
MGAGAGRAELVLRCVAVPEALARWRHGAGRKRRALQLVPTHGYSTKTTNKGTNDMNQGTKNTNQGTNDMNQGTKNTNKGTNDMNKGTT